MAELKTKENNASVKGFIDSLDDEQKKKDSYKLLEIFEDITKEKPKMWGTSIIGFGKYHYKSERSKQEGWWPLIGFSPRKTALTLYIMCGVNWNKDLLKDMGKYKMSSGSCMYVKRLSDLNLDKLKNLIKESFSYSKKKFL
ncbi:MAG: DUF1801 domain-containing protein [Candidatus Pacearchaeota archaeon]